MLAYFVLFFTSFRDMVKEHFPGQTKQDMRYCFNLTFKSSFLAHKSHNEKSVVSENIHTRPMDAWSSEI